MKSHSLPLAVVCFVVALPAAAQDAERGRALFESNCMRCHRDGAASLKTPLADAPALLATSKVRAHRFKLSEADLKDIVAWLAAPDARK